MEKKQYELCKEILKRFHDNDILQNIILVGSWCLPFYKEYFRNCDFRYTLRTRDIDFLIPIPSKIRRKVDIAALLKDLGFILTRSYPAGYIRLQHPDIIVEFLIPEKGKGMDKPFPLPQLGINAQGLRFLDLLTQNTITVEVENVSIVLPHPINFALHKLIISQRRQNAEKTEKDLSAAVQILEALIKIGEKENIKRVYTSLPKKWQQKITGRLKAGKYMAILECIIQ
ncbi:MAG: GSU2403 family nucleotidyltransferase fold protein [Elusimicrobiota bacterium]